MKAIDIAIEASTEVVIDSMVSLVKFFTNETVAITLDQFEKVTLWCLTNFKLCVSDYN